MAAIHDRILEFPRATTPSSVNVPASGGGSVSPSPARCCRPEDPRARRGDVGADTASEVDQEALSSPSSGRTTLAVAHRLSTIQAADVIHVIDHGRIVESASHDELRPAVRIALYDEQFGPVRSRPTAPTVSCSPTAQSGGSAPCRCAVPT